jgi:tetratricopeptide (TPR) repeat protein
VIAAGGRRVETTSQLLATLASASAGAPIELEWVSPGGSSRKGALQASRGPLLLSGDPGAELAAYRAAWAVVDIACRSSEARAARANLALLFSVFGHHELAVETWRKVAWGAREGIGDGTTQYYLGRALQALGREDEAVAAYRRAAESSSTAFHDEGPPIAPAALDRLADLGQTVASPSVR